MVGLVAMHYRDGSLAVRIEFAVVIVVGVAVIWQRALIFFICNFDLCHTDVVGSVEFVKI